MEITWDFTVLSAMESSSPISRFVLPDTSHASTCISRAVRVGVKAEWRSSSAGTMGDGYPEAGPRKPRATDKALSTCAAPSLNMDGEGPEQPTPRPVRTVRPQARREVARQRAGARSRSPSTSGMSRPHRDLLRPRDLGVTVSGWRQAGLQTDGPRCRLLGPFPIHIQGGRGASRECLVGSSWFSWSRLGVTVTHGSRR